MLEKLYYLCIVNDNDMKKNISFVEWLLINDHVKSTDRETIISEFSPSELERLKDFYLSQGYSDEN